MSTEQQNQKTWISYNANVETQNLESSEQILVETLCYTSGDTALKMAMPKKKRH